jgi:hypothetical protein
LPVTESLPLKQFGLVPAGFVLAAELLLATLSFVVSVDGTVEGVAGTVDGVVALLGGLRFLAIPHGEGVRAREREHGDQEHRREFAHMKLLSV